MPSFETPLLAASIIPEVGSDLVASDRAGLPFAALEYVRDYPNLLARPLGISAHTLSRRRDADFLTTDESDCLVLLAEIVALTQQALDSAEAASKWLRTPHAMPGGESPLNHMDTAVGLQESKSMLYHIEYGTPA